MKTRKKLDEIEKNTFEMGTREYEIFKKSNSIASLKASVDAYNATLKAIRYKLIYNNLKK
jgi:hypothetical protein